MDLATARLLTSPEGLALLDSLGAYDERTALATSERLRREGCSPALAAALLQQSALRTRARTKLGEAATELLLTADGLEQATRPVVARHHARRLVDAGMETVLDLGCGLGLDAVAMAGAGLAVEAVDADEVTAELARHNLTTVRVAPGRPHPVVRCARAEEVTVEAGARHTAVWLDPARRTPGVADISGRTRRTWRLEDLSPSWDLLQQLAGAVPAAGAKLSPAFPHAARPPGVEAQWVSWRGEVLECALWWGDAARHDGRTALVLDGSDDAPVAHQVTEDDCPAERPDPGSDDGEWLLEPDRALIRAGLVGALEQACGGAEVDHGCGYVRTSQQAGAPWARTYRVLAELPLHEKAIRAHLRSVGAGRVTLKKRGADVDPDRLRRALRLKGGPEAVLVLTRQAGRAVALHVDPV